MRPIAPDGTRRMRGVDGGPGSLSARNTAEKTRTSSGWKGRYAGFRPDRQLADPLHFLRIEPVWGACAVKHHRQRVFAPEQLLVEPEGR